MLENFWNRYYKYKVRFDDWLWEIKWIRTVRRTYWKLVPYDYRPHEIWYKTKCYLWHRYTTIKPRHLGHTWCDRSHLLPHIMFEILSDFVENECSPGHIEWYSEECPHKIKRGKELIWVRDEMQQLYDWWHKIYVPWSENQPELDAWHTYHKNHLLKEWTDLENGDSEYTPEFDNTESKLEDKRLFDISVNAERDMDRQLKRNMHRLVNIMDYMWT